MLPVGTPNGSTASVRSTRNKPRNTTITQHSERSGDFTLGEWRLLGGAGCVGVWSVVGVASAVFGGAGGGASGFGSGVLGSGASVLATGASGVGPGLCSGGSVLAAGASGVGSGVSFLATGGRSAGVDVVGVSAGSVGCMTIFCEAH